MIRRSQTGDLRILETGIGPERGSSSFGPVVWKDVGPASFVCIIAKPDLSGSGSAR